MQQRHVSHPAVPHTRLFRPLQPCPSFHVEEHREERGMRQMEDRMWGGGCDKPGTRGGAKAREMPLSWLQTDLEEDNNKLKGLSSVMSKSKWFWGWI